MEQCKSLAVWYLFLAGPNPDNPGFQQTVEIDLARCIGYKNCSEDCPWETITMYHHNDAFDAWGKETLKSELYVDEEQVKNPNAIRKNFL